VNVPHVHDEVCAAFRRYERALVENDLPALDAFFWQSEHVVRYGIADIQYGIEAVRRFRATTLADMRGRTLGPTVVTTFGQDLATANTEFRGIDARVIGRQSQTWARLEGGWRIVSAHVSMIASSVA
jgi:hypothetical protein